MKQLNGVIDFAQERYQLTAEYTVTDDDVIIALSGHPQWHDQSLAALAKTVDPVAAIQQLYHQYQSYCTTHIQGEFCLAIVDKKKRALLLANDRFNTQSIYYYHNKSTLYFATQLTDLVKASGRSFTLSHQAIYHYLYFHCIPAPLTIYQEVKKLLPAQQLDFNGNQTTYLHTYWNPTFGSANHASKKQLSATLRDGLQRAVADASDSENTGAFLSGGLDSSSVAGMLAKAKPEQAATFTIGFSTPGYDESEYAKISADHFNTKHHTHFLTPAETHAAIPDIVQHLSEPFGNSSVVPTYYCAKVAKQQGMTAMLAGDGGDELFAGNTRYHKQQVFNHYYRLPLWLRRNFLEHGLLKSNHAKTIPLLRKIVRYVEQARVPLPDRLQSYNFLYHGLHNNVFQHEFMETVNLEQPMAEWRDRYAHAKASSSLDRMLYLDWKFTLADNDLVKVSSMCALADMPVRYPMLDHRVVDTALAVPTKWKIKGSQLRYFYKYACKDFLARSTLNKSKHGFGLPFGVWLRDDKALNELANDALLQLKQRAIFQATFIDDALYKHQHEHAAYYGELVWLLMTLELWLSAHRH